MARIEMDAFEEGEEIVRVYLAASLAEARSVERALDAAGFEYGVEVESYTGRSVLAGGVTRRGAGFWVVADDLDATAAALERAGLVRGLVER